MPLLAADLALTAYLTSGTAFKSDVSPVDKVVLGI